jgi:hypothetical protein
MFVEFWHVESAMSVPLPMSVGDICRCLATDWVTLASIRRRDDLDRRFRRT